MKKTVKTVFLVVFVAVMVMCSCQKNNKISGTDSDSEREEESAVNSPSSDGDPYVSETQNETNSEVFSGTEAETTPHKGSETVLETESETKKPDDNPKVIRAEDLPGAADASWKPVPLVSKEQKDAGKNGGEGGQWLLYLTYAYTDGNIAYAGTDVGGMYKSKDAGKSWTPCTVGIESSGVTGIEVDPTNKDRVLAVGCNSGAFATNGLYLSTDGGASFHGVLLQKIVGHRDFRPQIAYDISSYDKDFGGCKTVYWSRETKIYSKGGFTDCALYRSDDGGEKWTLVCNDSNIGGAQIFCNPETGAVYAANDNGTFVSTDNGKTFTSVLSGACLSIDVIPTKPNNVYVTKKDALYISTDSGKSFSAVSKTGYPASGYPSHLRVSPANPDYMLLQNDLLTGSGQYKSDTYFSHDGGKTWTKSNRDVLGSFIPYNARQNNLAFHPTDKNICLSFGGDFIMRSSDGGVNFTLSNDGYNAGCLTRFAFNVNNPDLVAVSNQDYSGAFSTDGGETWTYANVYYAWGGYTYGGYMADANTVIFICNDKDNFYGMGKNVYIIIRSDDGGKTFKSTGANVGGKTNVMGVVGDENVILAGNLRSGDKGKTWSEVDGVTSVYTYELDGGAVYGANGKELVKSTDKGITWKVLAKLSSDISDLAYDNSGDTVYALTSDGSVCRVNCKDGKVSPVALPKGGSIKPKTLACDPFDGNILYVGNALNVAKSMTSVIRSTDGGKTWQNMTRTPSGEVKGLDGGVEVSFMRTHPLTGALYTIGGCRGMWTAARPF